MTTKRITIHSIVLLSAVLGTPVAIAQDDAVVGGGSDDVVFLRPLDEAVEDIGPIGTSLRIDTRVNLQQPLSFRDVYAGPDGDLMRISGALYAVFPRSRYSVGGSELLADIPDDTVFRIGTPFDSGAIAPATPSAATDNPYRVGERLNMVYQAEVDGELVGGRIDLKVSDVDGETGQVVGPSPRRSGGAAEELHDQPLPRENRQTSNGGLVWQRSSIDALPPALAHEQRSDIGETIVTSDSYREHRLRELLLRAATGELAERSPAPDAVAPG